MPNSGIEIEDNNSIKWDLDFLSFMCSCYPVARNPKAKMIKYAIQFARTMIQTEMRTYDQELFNNTANNILQNIVSDIRDNRDYIDIKNFFIGIYTGKIKYNDITETDIENFCKMFYSKVSEEAEKVRMKTEIWDYENSAPPEEDEEEQQNLFDQYLDAAINDEIIGEGEDTLPDGDTETDKSEEQQQEEMSEEDIKAMEEAVPDESVATLQIDGTLHQEDDSDDDLEQ